MESNITRDHLAMEAMKILLGKKSCKKNFLDKPIKENPWNEIFCDHMLYSQSKEYFRNIV